MNKITKIIVEGPNNVGKTTFINKLKSLSGMSGWKVIHCTDITPNNYEYFNELLTSNDKIIFDRAHVGEMIYPKLGGRTGNLTNREYHKLLVNDDNTLYIFIFADYDFVEQGYANKNEVLDENFYYNERDLFVDEYTHIKSICQNVLCIHNEL